MLQALLPILGSIGGKIAGNLFPDPADELKRLELETAVQRELMEQAGAIEQAAAGIINTEAASQHWLAANWRPLTMVTFVVLIVARWFGWAAPDLSEAEYLKLWGIVELGLGGYVIGRSAEKIAPGLIEALKGK
jgi:hypothetical protein